MVGLEFGGNIDTKSSVGIVSFSSRKVFDNTLGVVSLRLSLVVVTQTEAVLVAEVTVREVSARYQQRCRPREIWL